MYDKLPTVTLLLELGDVAALPRTALRQPRFATGTHRRSVWMLGGQPPVYAVLHIIAAKVGSLDTTDGRLRHDGIKMSVQRNPSPHVKSLRLAFVFLFFFLPVSASYRVESCFGYQHPDHTRCPSPLHCRGPRFLGPLTHEPLCVVRGRPSRTP